MGRAVLFELSLPDELSAATPLYDDRYELFYIQLNADQAKAVRALRVNGEVYFPADTGEDCKNNYYSFYVDLVLYRLLFNKPYSQAHIDYKIGSTMYRVAVENGVVGATTTPGYTLPYYVLGQDRKVLPGGTILFYDISGTIFGDTYKRLYRSLDYGATWTGYIYGNTVGDGIVNPFYDYDGNYFHSQLPTGVGGTRRYSANLSGGWSNGINGDAIDTTNAGNYITAHGGGKFVALGFGSAGGSTSYGHVSTAYNTAYFNDGMGIPSTGATTLSDKNLIYWKGKFYTYYYDSASGQDRIYYASDPAGTWSYATLQASTVNKQVSLCGGKDSICLLMQATGSYPTAKTYFWYSPDGANWTNRGLIPTDTTTQVNGFMQLRFGNNKYYMIGYKDNTNGYYHSLTQTDIGTSFTHQAIYGSAGTPVAVPPTLNLYDTYVKSTDQLIVGFASGFSAGVTTPYFENRFYEPRLVSVPSVKKSIDPLFFGIIKYQAWSPVLNNVDGYFDNWRAMNAYGQTALALTGEDGDAYDDYDRIFTGFVDDDSRDFSQFSVKIQDARKALSQPIATSRLTQAEFPYLDDGDVDKVKPVVYGTVYKRLATRLNTTQVSPATYTYFVCDITYNAIVGSVSWYNSAQPSKNGTATATAGIISLSAANSQDADGELADIYVTFTCGDGNGVEIIKDLLYRYDGVPYVTSLFDTAEVAVASAACRDTSLYIDSDKSLSSAIGEVCFDCDIRFFIKDSGKYTMRLYDENRVPALTIKSEDWLDEPNISNSGSQYLTECTVKYAYNEMENKWSQHTNKTHEAAAFAIYKKYKPKTFETALSDLTAATAKSETIMAASADVKDVVTRALPWDYSTLELCDFVYASPFTRVGAAETLATYEVQGVEKNPLQSKVVITLQKVTDNGPVVYERNQRVTSGGDLRVTSDGGRRITYEVV